MRWALILLTLASFSGMVVLLTMPDLLDTVAEPSTPIDSSRQKTPSKKPAKPELKPTPLTDVPKLDEKSKLTALNKEKTLYLEVASNGTKRVHFATEVCLREGLLEVFVCKKNTKEHEAILRTDIDARFIHAALVAAGAKVGKPVQFVDPKTNEPLYKPASGATIEVTVSYQSAGKTKSHRAQDWILDIKTKKPMAYDWVFAGSRFLKNSDKPDEPDYYCANNGEVIGISNFVDSMLDLPVEISADNVDLHFDIMPNVIPALETKVWVTLQAQPEREKK